MARGINAFLLASALLSACGRTAPNLLDVDRATEPDPDTSVVGPPVTPPSATGGFGGTPPSPPDFIGPPRPPSVMPPIPVCSPPSHEQINNWLEPITANLTACVDNAAMVSLTVEIDSATGDPTPVGRTVRGSEATCVGDLLDSGRVGPTCPLGTIFEVTLTVDRAPGVGEGTNDTDAGVAPDPDSDGGLNDEVTEEGFLRVTTRPTAHVYVDGVLFGMTPLPEIVLSIGTHDLVLINEDAGEIRVRQVNITANTTTTVVDRLTPLR